MKKKYSKPIIYDIEFDDVIATSSGLQADSGFQEPGQDGGWTIEDF